MKKNELQVKEVSFLGDTLLAAQDEGGTIWAGVRWMCEGIGLSDGQSKSERKRVQEDEVLSEGGRNIVLPTNGGNQSVLCIALDYIPLWLAKISVTPAMKKENPELAERLITYQLKAKDILAEAFLPTLRKTGTYTMPQADDKALERQKRAEAMLLNARTRAANTYLKMAEISTGSSQYKNILVAKAAQTLSGEELLPLPMQERKTYSAGDIGEMFGVSASMIGRIANKNDLKIPEYGEMYRSKSEYSNKEVDTWRYYETVLPRFEELLGRVVA